MFRQVFIDTVKAFTPDTTLPGELWSDIATRYSAGSRYYHNLHHLDTLIRELSDVRGAIRDWDMIVLAVAYHDIIYNILKQDNEEQSAAYARKKLAGILPPARLDRCEDLILATKSHAENSDPDIAHFTDADLSILGAELATYQLYTVQIRREYGHYPEVIYRPGRQKVLQHFLDMPGIYKSEAFYNKYELKARVNLNEEMKALSVW